MPSAFAIVPGMTIMNRKAQKPLDGLTIVAIALILLGGTAAIGWAALGVLIGHEFEALQFSLYALIPSGIGSAILGFAYFRRSRATA